MAYSVVDTVVASRYSAASLAALSVGSAVYVSVFVALLGVMQALLPILSEHRGAQRLDEVGKSFRQAIYLFAILCAVGLAVLLSPGAILRWTEVPGPMLAEVEVEGFEIAIVVIAVGMDVAENGHAKSVVDLFDQTVLGK